MSLKNRFFSVLICAIAVAGFSAFTMAQDSKTTTPDKSERHERGEGRGWGKGEGHGEGHGGPGGGMMRMLHDLDLTEAQKTQIHSIMEANKPDPASKEEMETLWKAKKDGTLTPAQQDRFTTLKTQMMEKMKSVHEQILAVLTPDQRAKLEQRKQQEREEHQRDRQKTPAATTPKPTDN